MSTCLKMNQELHLKLKRRTSKKSRERNVGIPYQEKLNETNTTYFVGKNARYQIQFIGGLLTCEDMFSHESSPGISLVSYNNRVLFCLSSH